MDALRRYNKRVGEKAVLILLTLAGLLIIPNCSNPMTTSTPPFTTEQLVSTHLGLAYYSERDDIPNQGALYLLDLASGEERRLTGKDEVITLYAGFSWSSTTYRFVYVAGLGEKAEIYTVDVTGQHRERLTNNNWEEASPLWSPNGQWILFQRRGGEIGDTAQRAYVMNADGSGQRRLVDDPSIIGGGIWSPDGRQIALLVGRGSTQGNVNDILILDATSGKEILRIADNRKSAAAMVWSHDGKKLAYIAYSFQDNLYQLYAVDMTTGNQTELSELGDVLSCDWSSDDQKLAFNAVQNKTFDIYTIRSDGTDLVNLTQRTGFSVKVGGKWSPDGRRIAFSAAESEQDGESALEVYVLEVESGAISRVTHNQFPDAPPRWVAW